MNKNEPKRIPLSDKVKQNEPKRIPLPPLDKNQLDILDAVAKDLLEINNEDNSQSN